MIRRAPDFPELARDWQAIISDFDKCGLLTRVGGGFALEADDGTRWLLDLHRVPVDNIEKRVRVVGQLLSHDLVEAEGVSAA